MVAYLLNVSPLVLEALLPMKALQLMIVLIYQFLLHFNSGNESSVNELH